MAAMVTLVCRANCLDCQHCHLGAVCNPSSKTHWQEPSSVLRLVTNTVTTMSLQQYLALGYSSFRGNSAVLQSNSPLSHLPATYETRSNKVGLNDLPRGWMICQKMCWNCCSC